LQMLGVPPVAGRLLTAADDVPGVARAVVISDGLWTRAFGRDKSVVGRTIQLNGRAATIAGIMPPQFQFPVGELTPTEMWVPLQVGPPNQNQRGSHYLYLLGRLKDGSNLASARQELEQFAQTSAAQAAPNVHTFAPRSTDQNAPQHPLVAYGLYDEVVG